MELTKFADGKVVIETNSKAIRKNRGNGLRVKSNKKKKISKFKLYYILTKSFLKDLIIHKMI